MYHHGEIERYIITSVTKLDIRFGSFTDNETKKVDTSITEGEKISLLELKYDKDHNEILTIHRGVVKEISTNAVRYDMSNESRMGCIIIKMDCSSEGKSDIRYIKLCDVVEVHEIDYEYEEIKRLKCVLQNHPDKWTEELHPDRTAEIDITNNHSIKIEE